MVLSGSGADGSLGLKAIKQRHGLVIAQDPEEAGFDGMPRSAIMTGAVDLVLPIEKMPEAIGKYGRRVALMQTPERRPSGGNHAGLVARDYRASACKDRP